MPFNADGKRRETTLSERVEVIEARTEGKSFRQIAEEVPVSKSEAERIYAKWKEEKKVLDNDRSGRPHILSDRDKRRLNRLAEDNPEATIEEIAGDSSLGVSERTVGDHLRSENYYIRFARKKPWLDEDKKRRRRVWCAGRKKWSKEQWQTRIFTDECKIELGQGGKRKMVRRKPGVENAYKDKYLEPTFRSGRFSIMVWAAVGYGCHTPIVLVRRRTEAERERKNDKLGMNATQYVNEILNPYLLNLVNALPNSRDQYETIEDGHRVHTSQKATNWREKNNIKKSNWPASSPDLNMIENCWPMLKARMKKRMRDPLKRPRSEEELFEQAQEEWEKLDWDKIYKIIDRMPKRIIAVLKNKGGHTKW